MPQKTYSTSLLELQSLHKVTQFVKNCGKDHFYVNPVQTSRQCQEDVFSLTIGFNGGPLACKCNPIGSKSSFCVQFGGQCPCLPNVVGRICNRCRLGYSGFPRCKREYVKFILFLFYARFTLYPARISRGWIAVYTLTGTCFCTITLCIKLVPFRRLVRIPDEVILLDWKGSFSKGNYQSIVFRPLLFWNLVLINNINNVREPSLLACS